MSKYWSLLVFSALFMSTLSGTYAQDIQMWSSSFVESQIKSKSTASLEKGLSALKTEQLIAKLATDQEKKSFWINIYNGFIIKKIRANPESYQKRSSFFSKRDISIAGQLFSFDDIEHVILRKQQWKYGLGFVNKPFVSKLFEALSVNKLDSKPPPASSAPIQMNLLGPNILHVAVSRLCPAYVGPMSGYPPRFF